MVEQQKSDRYVDILKAVTDILNSKDTQYHTDPIGVLSVDDLLCQIKIKAIRAQLTSPGNFTKLEDELLDIIVYSILTLKKVQSDRPVMTCGTTTTLSNLNSNTYY